MEGEDDDKNEAVEGNGIRWKVSIDAQLCGLEACMRRSVAMWTRANGSPGAQI